MKQPTITIHYGAGAHTVTVDGREFDMNALTPGDRSRFRRLIVASLEKIGRFA